MTANPWGAPEAAPTEGWQMKPPTRATVLPSTREHSLTRDLATFAAIVVTMVFLASPLGLLWAHVAPHYHPVLDQGTLTIPNIESDKAAVGADGSYFVVMGLAGLISGFVAWYVARRSGPWTVVALLIGGTLGALIAARVGLLPGRLASLHAVAANKAGVPLYLGARDVDHYGRALNTLHLRAPWAAVAWPLGALLAFAGPALVTPEELD